MNIKLSGDNSLIRANLFEKTDSVTALQLLRAGNLRYINGAVSAAFSQDNRKRLADEGQSPFAVIFGCSDSRVPPEIIFDVGPGQLFVVRTAGNVADDIAIGSVEYAVEHLHTRLVVVLGHEKCGAVAAAVSGLPVSPCIAAIMTEIKPSLEKALKPGNCDAACRCEDENILHTIKKLKSSSVLKSFVDAGVLDITGAKYSLNSGVVSFI